MTAGPLVYLNVGLPALRTALGLPEAQMVDAAGLTDASCAHVVVLVTGGSEPVPHALVERFPALKLIVAVAAGYDGIDLDHAKARGIMVTSSIGANAGDVADMAVGSLIALVRGIVSGDHEVRAGLWEGRVPTPSRSMGSLKIGIVGMGFIGQAIATRLAACGCTIAWHGPRPKAVGWPRMDSLDALAQASNCLIVAAALTPQTEGMVSADILAALGPEGYFVNVGRGGLVDEDALIAALRDGRIAGAALDVFAQEPTPPERWRDVPNIVLTPHKAGATRDSMVRLLERTRENVLRGLAGQAPDIRLA